MRLKKLGNSSMLDKGLLHSSAYQSKPSSILCGFVPSVYIFHCVYTPMSLRASACSKLSKEKKEDKDQKKKEKKKKEKKM